MAANSPPKELENLLATWEPIQHLLNLEVPGRMDTSNHLTER